MMNLKRATAIAVVALMAATASQSALADRKTKHTLIGAGIGGLAGALLSNGDPMAALAGAAAGGVVGNVTTDNDRHRGRGRQQQRPPQRHDDRGHGRDQRGDQRGDQDYGRGHGR
jgi:uncharacterized protein YcfJ